MSYSEGISFRVQIIDSAIIRPKRRVLNTEQRLKATKKNTQKEENFQSDYRGGKVAPDKVRKLFFEPCFESPSCQFFHKEVNDAGKKMNHLRQHTAQLWQVSTGESDTCKYHKED